MEVPDKVKMGFKKKKKWRGKWGKMGKETSSEARGTFLHELSLNLASFKFGRGPPTATKWLRGSFLFGSLLHMVTFGITFAILILIIVVVVARIELVFFLPPIHPYHVNEKEKRKKKKGDTHKLKNQKMRKPMLSLTD